MRVSVFPTDSGYVNYPEWRGCKVYVDGALVEKVFTADTEQGYVVCAELDTDGSVVIRGDEVGECTIRGKVELVK